MYDGQDLNQGCFLAEKNERLFLCGLDKMLDFEDINRIGLSNLAQTVRDDYKFLKAVREYRILDLS